MSLALKSHYKLETKETQGWKKEREGHTDPAALHWGLLDHFMDKLGKSNEFNLNIIASTIMGSDQVQKNLI